MAYPIDPKQGFPRTPTRFPHDAFGVDTGGRVRPHSGFDSTPTVANAEARSVLGGTVVKADWTKYAGNYVVEDAPDGWLWLSIHLASRSVRPGDDTRQTRPGSVIGIVGNTGGGGALGSKATIGIHSHVSRCRDMAAVNRIVNGLVRARYKGETNAEWADAHGLSDPYPHIIESLKASAPAADKGFLMALTDDEQAEVLRLLRENETRAKKIDLWVEAVRGDQLDENGLSRSARIHRLIEGATAKVDGLYAEIADPGTVGYSWAARARSVLNRLEAKFLTDK